MIRTKKFFCALIAALIFTSPLWAQRYIDSDDEVEDLLSLEDENIIEIEELDENMLAASKYVLTLIESSQPHDLNPQTSTFASDAQLFTGIYEGLFSYEPSSLEPVPAICEKYKISRDKKRWTFSLRENAKFSDGSPITANDVRRSWLTLLSTPNAPYSSMLDIICGAAEYRKGTGDEKDVAINVISSNTLSIRLDKPASYLPKLLCHAAFSVTHRTPTVFSGAYFISDMKNNQIILEKNPFYWDVQNVQIKMFCLFQSLGAEENTYFYNTGFADWLSTYEFVSNKILNQDSLKINAEFGTQYMFFKNSSIKPALSKTNPVWDRPDFRLAVLEAMPWDILRKSNYVKATTLVYPLTDYPAVDGFSYTDSEEAKLLMMDARKNAGISEDEIIPLYMDLSEGSFLNEELKAIQDALLPLGVNVIINNIPFSDYFSYIESSDSDIGIYNWIGDFADPLAFLELFRGDSTLNITGWKNEEFDSLIDEASSVSGAPRNQLLAEAENILLNDGMVLPISHPVSAAIINTNEIGGWFPNAFNIHPLKYIFKKEVKPDLTNCF